MQVKFFHLHDRLHNFVGSVARQERRKFDGSYFPGKYIPIFQTAAHAFLTTVASQLGPEIINFLLVVTVNDERDSFREFEAWSTVKRDEFFPFEFKRGREQ